MGRHYLCSLTVCSVVWVKIGAVSWSSMCACVLRETPFDDVCEIRLIGHSHCSPIIFFCVSSLNMDRVLFFKDVVSLLNPRCFTNLRYVHSSHCFECHNWFLQLEIYNKILMWSLFIFSYCLWQTTLINLLSNDHFDHFSVFVNLSFLDYFECCCSADSK